MTHSSQASLALAPTADPGTRVRVWDLFVRLFHWGLVASVLIAYFTEDDLLDLHTWAGYTVLGLIGARLLWGLVGSPQARWSSFVRGPRTTLAYVSDALQGRAARYLGHNPAGAAMVVALLLGLTTTALTGVALLGAGEAAGPLAPYLQGMSPAAAHDLEEIHEWTANLTMLLVPIHLIGVAFASRQHGENLVRAMIDGYKRGEQP